MQELNKDEEVLAAIDMIIGDYLYILAAAGHPDAAKINKGVGKICRALNIDPKKYDVDDLLILE